MSSSCGQCRALADELANRRSATHPATDRLSAVDLLLVTDPEGGNVFHEIHAASVVVQAAGEVSKAWSVPGTPFAVAIDRTGIVRAAAFAASLSLLHHLAATIDRPVDATHAMRAGVIGL